MKDKNANTDAVVENDEDTVVESTSAIDALKVLVESKETFDDSFLEEVSTIFQSGLDTAIKDKTVELERANEEKQTELEEAFAEKIDAYLTYAVEQWIEENELAVDTSLKSQISEDFLSGLKTLFAENYVELPEGKEDMYDQAVKENTELNEQLDSAESELAKYKETCESYARKEIFDSVSEGMSETEKERFENLIESVEFETTEKYQSKLDILRKAFIDKDDNVAEDVAENSTKGGKTFIEDMSGGEDLLDEIDPLVARVLASLKKK